MKSRNPVRRQFVAKCRLSEPEFAELERQSILEGKTVAALLRDRALGDREIASPGRVDFLSQTTGVRA
jgi:hypothetical protein